MAAHTPPPTGGASAGATTGIPLVDQVQKMFNEPYKANIDWGALVGATDVETREIARGCAKKAKKWINSNSPLRHPFMNRGLGVVSGRLDTLADKTPDQVKKTLLRKMSDFIDEFCGEFFEKDELGEDESKMDSKAAEIFRLELMKSFAKDGGEFAKEAACLIRAAGVDPEIVQDVTENMKSKAAGIWKVQQTLAYGPKPAKEPGVPIGEHIKDAGRLIDEAATSVLAPVVNELEKGTVRLKAYNQRLAQEVERARQARAQMPQRSTLLRRFLRRLFIPKF